MSLMDSRGNPLSTHNRLALAHYERALDLLHGYYLDPLAAIDQAIEEDPAFVSAHCLRASLMLLALEQAPLAEARRSLDDGERYAAHANERERAHLAAARRWADGEIEAAVGAYGQILSEYPRDSLALQIAHTGDFALGQTLLLRDRIAWVLPHWDSSVPGYSYLLGMQAFGLEECGDYARAEDRGREALERQPRDAWAVHAVTHVMEMQGRVDDGVRWLRSREHDWAQDNFLAYHNWWHLTLFMLDSERYADALELYDRAIRPQRTPVAMEMVDATALLWRLHLRGVEIGDRAQLLADDWIEVNPQPWLGFNDWHSVLAYIMAGRVEELEAQLQRQRAAACDGQGRHARQLRELTLPLCEALAAFGRGAYGAALDGLLGLRYAAQQLGGSHAQRDLLHLSCLEAALRAGHAGWARALAAERCEIKSDSVHNWRLGARAARVAGLESVASDADTRAERTRAARCVA